MNRNEFLRPARDATSAVVPCEELGWPKEELDTPVLCLDLDRMTANMQTIVHQCRSARVAWRPHVKCHKSPQIAHRQLQAGARGITCAKLGEAEVMAAAGIRDILIANLLLGPLKMQRLARLCQAADPLVCVDSAEQLAPLGEAAQSAACDLRVLVEVDIGMHRVGTAPGGPAVALAQQVAATPGLCLAGVMGYEGHLLLVADPREKAARIHAALALLVGTAEQIRAARLPCPLVSCGGTGSYVTSVTHPGITEVQAGGAIFMDQFYRTMCHVDQLGHALTVLATVVSCPAPDRVIIDAGRKTLDTQVCLPRVLDYPGLEIDYLSAEHGVLKLNPDAPRPQLGQRLELVPGYVDFTTVLHDEFHVIQNGRLIDRWPLTARGRLR